MPFAWCASSFAASQASRGVRYVPNARLAEARLTQLHRYIDRLKRLERQLKMKTLTEHDASNVLNDLFEEMVEELERRRWAEYRRDREKEPSEWSEFDEAAFGNYDELEKILEGTGGKPNAVLSVVAREGVDQLRPEGPLPS